MDDSPGKITEQYKRVKEIDATKVKKLSNTELNERIQDAQDVMKYCRENPNRTIVGIGNTNDINAEVYRIYNDILGPENVNRRQTGDIGGEGGGSSDDSSITPNYDGSDTQDSTSGISQTPKNFDPNDLKADTIKQKADAFANHDNNLISNEDLSNIFIPLARILAAVGTVILVIVTIFIGIKYMTAGPNDKGKLKQKLIALTIAAIVLFAAQGIWALVYNFMKEVTQ